MQAVKAAHVLAVRPGLPSETGSIGRHLHREVRFTQNGVPVDIGHGHLRRRHQIEFVQRHKVHLSLLVRQLTSTETGRLIDHDRRLNLHIAGACIEIQKILNQGPLKLGALALIYRETRTCQLHAQVKVYDIVFCRKLPVGKSTFLQMRHLTAHTHHHIVIGIPACGHYVIRDIGQQHQKLVLKLLALLHLSLDLLGVFLHTGHFLLRGLGLILPALLHQATYFLCFGLLGRESCVQLCLAGAPYPVLLKYSLDYRGCVKVLHRQSFDYELRFFPQKFKSQHLSIIFSTRKDNQI